MHSLKALSFSFFYYNAASADSYENFLPKEILSIDVNVLTSLICIDASLIAAGLRRVFSSMHFNDYYPWMYLPLETTTETTCETI